MGYLQATKKIVKKVPVKVEPRQDIIVSEAVETIVETEEGRLIKTSYKKRNVTKIMNETKKLVKGNTATEKLAEIEKIFTK